jgi:hypothetical protein
MPGIPVCQSYDAIDTEYGSDDTLMRMRMDENDCATLVWNDGKGPITFHIYPYEDVPLVYADFSDYSSFYVENDPNSEFKYMQLSHLHYDEDTNELSGAMFGNRPWESGEIGYGFKIGLNHEWSMVTHADISAIYRTNNDDLSCYKDDCLSYVWVDGTSTGGISVYREW